MIAPRNCLIYSPVRDRFADPDDIDSCIGKAQKAWGDEGTFVFQNPDDICRFQKDQQDIVIAWLNKTGDKK
jgi:hypothetical protein